MQSLYQKPAISSARYVLKGGQEVHSPFSLPLFHFSPFYFFLSFVFSFIPPLFHFSNHICLSPAFKDDNLMHKKLISIEPEKMCIINHILQSKLHCTGLTIYRVFCQFTMASASFSFLPLHFLLPSILSPSPLLFLPVFRYPVRPLI